MNRITDPITAVRLHLRRVAFAVDRLAADPRVTAAELRALRRALVAAQVRAAAIDQRLAPQTPLRPPR